MTNYEKYKNEIDKITRMGRMIAVEEKTGKITSCNQISCSQCKFDSCVCDCDAAALAWADAEYIEQEVDWSKVPVDTPVLISDDGTNWVKGYFAKYKDGKIYAFTDDAHHGIVRGQQAEIVRKWAEEHPRKTRKDVLLEKFPNATLMDNNGGYMICAEYLGLCSNCEKNGCAKCWNTEVE